jgi:[ribosomal protein S5]-alanine N-acetyltransferase
VTERSSGALIGDGGLHPLGGVGPDVELGYTLARSAWGRGYATELGRALVEYAFTALRVPRVVAQVEPANTASRHVLAKLGMSERETRTAYGRPHLLYALEARPPAAPRDSSLPR